MVDVNLSEGSSPCDDGEVLRSYPGLIRALTKDLTAAGYTVAGVEDFLGASAYAAMSRGQFVPALMRIEELARPADPIAVLIRLFPLACVVPAQYLDDALPALGVAGMVDLGLITPTRPPSSQASVAEQEHYRAAVDLSPYGLTDAAGSADLWVSSDLAGHQRRGVLRHDHVVGVGQASLTLAQYIVREPVERALDVGVGCGIQTFHLLRHARQVVATDISDRALCFARFNLMLNAGPLGLDLERLEERVELRRGHLTEPVVGERFDLIVSNPPFVITPRSAVESDVPEPRFTYRDGGLPGDEVVAALLRALPELLRPGGTAQLLGNWEIPFEVSGAEGATTSRAASWYQRLSDWVSPRLDAWIIQREELSAEEYAETWLQDAFESCEPEAYERSYRAYVEDFAARGVRAVGFGSVWARRPDDGEALGRQPQRLRRFEEISHAIEQPIGPHLSRAVDRAAWLAGNGGPELLDLVRLVVPEDVTEERHQRPGEAHPAVILLRQGSGFRRARLLSSELAGLVSACDGTLTLGQILSALRALLGEQLELSVLRDQTRELIADGFLEPQEFLKPRKG